MCVSLKYTAVDFSYPDGGTGIVIMAHRNVLRDHYIICLSVVFSHRSGFGIYRKTSRSSRYGIDVFVYKVGYFKGKHGVFTVVEVGAFL